MSVANHFLTPSSTRTIFLCEFRKRKLENGQSSTQNHNSKAEVKLIQYDTTPDFIVGEMHDYQIRGLNWLISLCEHGIGGILGDEMGLGEYPVARSVTPQPTTN